MKWIGPLTIQKLLGQVLAARPLHPPESKSAYVITERIWSRKPTFKSGVLYIGSNTGRSARFRTRVGDLLADLFGFFTSSTGHQSGGRNLHKYCRKKKVDPMKLFIGWVDDCDCMRCLEGDLFEQLKPLLNQKRPSGCRVHGG